MLVKNTNIGEEASKSTPEPPPAGDMASIDTSSGFIRVLSAVYKAGVSAWKWGQKYPALYPPYIRLIPA